jgi:hypothetical protein
VATVHGRPDLPGDTDFCRAVRLTTKKALAYGRIIHDISDVAAHPDLEWLPQVKAGTTFIANGMRDGVVIRVVIRNDEIISGFPTNTSEN